MWIEGVTGKVVQGYQLRKKVMIIILIVGSIPKRKSRKKNIGRSFQVLLADLGKVKK